MFKKCSTFHEALALYQKSFNENTIEVVPVAGGPYDNPFVLDDPNSDGEWEDDMPSAS